MLFYFDMCELLRNLREKHRLEITKFRCVQAREFHTYIQIESFLIGPDPIVFTDVTGTNTKPLDDVSLDIE